MKAEQQRLRENNLSKAHWNRWGPYLSEREWGTVREDYSPHGTAWEYFPHDHARSRAYRWGEDGLGGICDRHGILYLAMALWNRRDPILKERLFGLTGNEGNHGEDVKEYYFYLDNTPTHSYMRFLYKYPQREFPYNDLVRENRLRGKEQPEFELVDTGIFDEDRYFDVFVEYAKATPDNVYIRYSIINRGPDSAQLDFLPTLWFRNTWSWKSDVPRPRLSLIHSSSIEAECEIYGKRWLHFEGSPEIWFTENETNTALLYHGNEQGFFKDAFHQRLVQGRKETICPQNIGTKAAGHYALNIPPGEQVIVRLNLSDQSDRQDFGESFDQLFVARKKEADEFYREITPDLKDDLRNIQRQSLSGLLWSKQFYYYDVQTWLQGDPVGPTPPPERLHGRNSAWQHVYNEEVLLMPDKWEYPWFAAWDMAFHCVACALVDPHFAKSQLTLLTREWYMNPNGAFPAYEWAFGDVNPPVHAWAALRIYHMEKKRTGFADRRFLETIFHKCLMNFTWWVNRKDITGRNVFEGGFLGMDNIGVFDRSSPLPMGGRIEQADGTAWMGMYSLNLMAIALELAVDNPAYADTASKFFEHFLYIAHALNYFGPNRVNLWDEEDGFYYDVLKLPDGHYIPLKVQSMVGLIPLLAVESLEPEVFERHLHFRDRARWFLENRSEFREYASGIDACGHKSRHLLSVTHPTALRRILDRMLDETQFLSPHGLRSLSRRHDDLPYTLCYGNHTYSVDYEPAESRSGVFGGNSNWRGPIWFPLNFLLIESLKKYHAFHGDSFQIECPLGSGIRMNLSQVANDLSRRLIRLYERNPDGQRPVFGQRALFQNNPHWRDYLPFHEYFHGDSGSGLGASHQTGWTSLIALLIDETSSC